MTKGENMVTNDFSRRIFSMGFGTLALVLGAMVTSLSGCAVESADQNDVSAEDSAVTIPATYIYTKLVASNTSTSKIHVNLSMGGAVAINADIPAGGSARMAPNIAAGTSYGTITVTVNGTSTKKSFTLPNGACDGTSRSLSIPGAPVRISYQCSN